MPEIKAFQAFFSLCLLNVILSSQRPKSSGRSFKNYAQIFKNGNARICNPAISE